MTLRVLPTLFLVGLLALSAALPAQAAIQPGKDTKPGLNNNTSPDYNNNVPNFDSKTPTGNVPDFGTIKPNEIGKANASDKNQKTPELKGYTLTIAQISDLMGQGDSCMQRHWVPGLQGFCCLGPDRLSPNGCRLMKKGNQFLIDYWEPSAIVEVSCRSGYSMLTPGKIQARGNAAIQSCQGFNNPGNSNWFFEARVWAINGKDGGLRHQAIGGTQGEEMRQCSEIGDDTLKTDSKGYAQKKWAQFDHPGDGSGPGGSWEAYISDKDSSWATNKGQKGSAMQECTGTSVPNCWGPINETGWVTHPNPTVAAALVALRAHTKALNMHKVSPALSAGYKMDMDFPFPKYAGDFGKSMGFPGGSKTGSACFIAGDPGPEWYGGMKPQEIPKFLDKLKAGNLKATADMNSGVYIFTFWVKTSCIRWRIPDSPGPPFGACTYVDTSS